MITALIDADTLVYEAAHANETSVQWDETTFTRSANFDLARRQLDTAVEEITTKLKADAVVMCLSDYNDPWRKKVLPDYKANRALTLKPLLFAPLREYIHETYETFQRPGLEADDVMGILSTNPVKIEGLKVIVSIDKDMRTIPGALANMTELRKNPAFFIETIPTHEADYRHMMQTLTGDRVDGYTGCPGIGPVKAHKVLTPALDGGFKVSRAWPLIVSAYEARGLTEEDALVQARVARICRHEDYNYTDRTVRLWCPN